MQTLPQKNDVLIVDDDFAMLELLREGLSVAGYHPVLASSGKECISRINDKKFNFAIIDVKLPDINGLDLVKQVKENSPDTTIIVITGFPNIDSALDALRTGVYDYLIKPFKLRQLARLLDRAKEEQQLHEENNDIRKRVEELETENAELHSRINEITQNVSTSNVKIHAETNKNKAIHSYSKQQKKYPLADDIY